MKKIIKKIYEIKELNDLEDYLTKQNISILRDEFFREFLKYSDYKSATDWNCAVRLCESLTIIGWGQYEAVQARKGQFFNGNPNTMFYTKYATRRFVDAIWAKRKNGFTMEQGRTSYFETPYIENKPTLLHDYITVENIEDIKLHTQRNWIPRNPILVTRAISNCYENSEDFFKSIDTELQPLLNEHMQEEKYGSEINRIMFYLSTSYRSANYIIADASLKLKKKDFATELLKIHSKEEINKEGYYLRNRYEYGAFRSKTGLLRITVHLEKEFSELSFIGQKEQLVKYLLESLEVIILKLKKKKLKYDLDLMYADFVVLLNEWKKL